MRAIRIDNGTTFKNINFKTFYASLGLEHQFSSQYVPRHNGIAE
jgi:transposase InsO family protein